MRILAPPKIRTIQRSKKLESGMVPLIKPISQPGVAGHTHSLGARLVPLLMLVLMLVLALTLSPWASAEDAAVADAGGDTRYVELKPTFVTNFGPTSSPRLMYIKTDVALRVAGADGESAAERHLPALRNALVLLLSRQPESAVATGAAREDIRKSALTELNEILASEEGEPYIKDLLFTNFIVQR